VPGLRNLPARIMAFGIRRVRLQRPQEIASPEFRRQITNGFEGPGLLLAAHDLCEDSL